MQRRSGVSTGRWVMRATWVIDVVSPARRAWLGKIPRRGVITRAQCRCLKSPWAIWREIGDPFGTANALNRLAAALRDCEEMDASIAMFEESLAVFRSLRVPTFIAQVLANLGKTERLRGNTDRAAVLLNESLKIRRHRRPMGHCGFTGVVR